MAKKQVELPISSWVKSVTLNKDKYPDYKLFVELLVRGRLGYHYMLRFMDKGVVIPIREESLWMKDENTQEDCEIVVNGIPGRGWYFKGQQEFFDIFYTEIMGTIK